jgi:hypothetical protein
MIDLDSLQQIDEGIHLNPRLESLCHIASSPGALVEGYHSAI